MNFNVVEIAGKKYIKGIENQKLIKNESDAVEVIGKCGENQVNRVMLHASNLDESFYDLKTRQAGLILQKFMNYSVKVALVIPSDYLKKERFREMAREANRGYHFHIFEDKNQAEQWLIEN